MSDRTQDLTNHRKVAVACKNYTDKEIKKVYYNIGHNDITTEKHEDEATYRFTAPANSKLLMLQSIAGNSNKIAPSTPSDDSVARLKVIPENTYKGQIDYIGGKTVKYNQLVNTYMSRTVSGITFTDNSNGTVSVSGTAESTDYFTFFTKISSQLIGGHKYLITTNSKYSMKITVNNIAYDNNTMLFTYTSTAFNLFMSLIATSGTTYNDTFSVELIDLTSIFGAGNEPSDVATAISLLKANGYKLDGTDEYSIGELKHAITTSAKYSPINLFDKSTVVNGKYVNINGEQTYASYSHSDYIEIDNNDNTYYVKNNTIFSYNVMIVCFDSNKNPIGYATVVGTNYRLWTLLPNTAYIILNMMTNEVDTQCINISNASYNGNYYPYVAPITKEIPSQVLADSRYGLGYDDNNYNHLDSDGHLRGNWGIVDLSTLNWFYNDNNRYAAACPSDLKPVANSVQPNWICSTYEPKPNSIDLSNNQNAICYIGAGGFLMVYASSGTAPKPTGYLVYELKDSFDTDYSQYFDTNWNKVDLDKQYATAEMVVDEPIDMPNKVEYYGTIIHALATAVKQDGFNIWDEEYVNEINSVSGVVASKNYIPVISGQQYYLCYLGSNTSFTVFYLYYYDDSYNQINDYSGSSFAKNTTITIPSNVRYIKFRTQSYYGTTYNNDICINISNQDLNGTYKPYKAPITRLLPNSEAKYSWGITDGVRNTRVFCDDEGNAVNEGSLAVGNQDLGSLSNWSYNTSSAVAPFFLATVPNIKNNTNPASQLANILCIKYNQALRQSSIFIDKTMCLDEAYIEIKDLSFDNPTIFKSAMSGVPLFYEKDQVSTEPLDDFDFWFDCEEGDTFTLVNTEQLQCYATYSFLIKEAKSDE